jgi:hypothetical protein
LIARTYRQTLAMTLASYAAPLGVIAGHGAAPIDRTTLFAWNAPVMVACYYLPALVMVLRRPNRRPPTP